MIRKFCILIWLFGLMPQEAWAAYEGSPDFFQSVGKIYVVVAVIALIFMGLALLLYRMDRRITNLEQNKHQ